jgi:hypothetical protein
MTASFFNCKSQLPVFGPSTIFLKSKTVYCFSTLTHKHENWDNKNGRQTIKMGDKLKEKYLNQQLYLAYQE